jgi:hypothetical protein
MATIFYDGIEEVGSESSSSSSGGLTFIDTSTVDLVYNEATNSLSANVQASTLNGKENALGNPSTSGMVLSSSSSGVRTWVTASSAGVATLNDLANVSVPTPTDGQVLAWSSATSSWVAVTITGTVPPTLDTYDGGTPSSTSTENLDGGTPSSASTGDYDGGGVNAAA